MSSVVISGDTSGTVTLQAPAVAGSSTINLPAGTGTAAVQGVSTNLVQGTAQNTTSGSSFLFTGIPSWAKRVSIVFNGVTKSAGANLLVQIGSGSVVSTGYSCVISQAAAAAVASSTATTGFAFYTQNSTSHAMHGAATLANVSGNIWVFNGLLADPVQTTLHSTAGMLTLSGALDRINITTSTGTETFSAGSINVVWE